MFWGSNRTDLRDLDALFAMGGWAVRTASLFVDAASSEALVLRPHQSKMQSMDLVSLASRIGHGIPAMEGQIAVKVVRSHEEIQEIAYVWRSWQCHPNSDLDFYLTVLRSKPEFLRPHVIVVYRDQCPEALLVGRLELRQVEARVGYARLLKMKTRALTFLYGGVLGTLSPEGSEALVNDIVNSLSQGEADLAYFNHLRADSPLYRAASKVSGLLRRDHFSHQQIHRAMIVPESPAKFYSQLSTKARKNLKWQAKKLTQEFPGKVEVRCFREKGDLERMFQGRRDDCQEDLPARPWGGIR